MHTLPGGRVGAGLPAAHSTGCTGALHALPSWANTSHSSSSHHAAHRRLLQPSGTGMHASALPKIGVVAVPDESLASARLSQQSSQQQQQQPEATTRRRVGIRRLSLGQQQDEPQPRIELHQQLSALQHATQQQQQTLWQAQQQVPFPGRQQQPWSAQYPTNGRPSSHQASARAVGYPTDRQQRQQHQPRQFQQQHNGRPSQSDQAYDAKPQQQAQRQQRFGGQQQQQQQQRQGQATPGRFQQEQSWPKQQQQTMPRRLGGPPGQADRFQQPPRQTQDIIRPQQQQQQQQQQRQSAHSDASDSGPDSSSSSSQLRFSHGLRQDWSLPTGMAVTYLGSSSGAPTRDRNVSCTVLRLPEALYLVDCGEGSSRQIKLTGLQLEQIDTLFITHLHGDHCFGIGTMLVAVCKARKAAAAAAAGAGSTASSSSSDGSGGVPEPDSPLALRVVGPPRVGELISSMIHIAGVGRQVDQPLYVTEFVETDSKAHDWQELPAPASASSSSSSGGCQAFIRRMAPTQQLAPQDWPPGLKRRLDRAGLQWQEANRRYYGNWLAKPGLLWQLPCRQALVTAAQLQHRVPCWGYVFEERLQQEAPPAAAAADSDPISGSGRRVVLLGDTVDSRPIAPVALGADLVSHEATFAAGMEQKAALAQHSTAWMAGQFAAAIQAKALVLTHFSARYEGSRANNKWGALAQGPDSGRQRPRGYERPEGPGSVTDADAEERCIKALQREADDQYGLGPVLLAIDLLTAHVPTKQEQGEEE